MSNATARSGAARGRIALIALTCLSLVLAGCARLIDGTPTLSSVPNARLSVHGGTGHGFDTQAANAISDVMAFWKTNYPSIANGAALPPLKGGLWSVDGAAVLVTDHAPASVAKEACIAKRPEFVVDNAAYCPADDSIIWDRAHNHLLPVLARHYGPALVAMVFAHEFGHALQHRLGILNQQLPTIDTESQADCASGAFIAGALHGQTPHFHLTDAQVDKALEGYLQIRDTTPESPADISHGNGFDRLSAVENGIEHGPTYCYSSTYFSTRSFTERPYTSDKDYTSGGNEPLAAVLDPNNPSKDPNAGGLQPSLNQYWTKAGTTVGKTFQAVKVAEADHPACGSVSPQSEFGYCPDDNTVYYDHAFAARAYDSLTSLSVDNGSADVTLDHHQPADFALGTLFAIGWGMAAWHQFFGGSTTSQSGLLTAICYTGAYAKTINVDTPPTGQASFVLSPPDMDEATSAMLNLVGLPQAYGARGTSGLERIQKFVTGYNGGLSACS